MKDKSGYLNIPKSWMQGWGQGLALAFLADMLQSKDIDFK
jgi:unsaturated rhamnogalacturonyl hydrolase